MQIKYSTIKQGAFYCSYFLILLFSMMGHIAGLNGYLMQLSQVAIVLLLALSIVQNHYINRNTLVIMAALFMYAGYMQLKVGFSGFFKLLLLIMASRSLDFKKILKFDIISRAILASLVIACCFWGIAPNISAAYPDGSIRYSWGFANSNHLGLLLFIIILELLYIWDMHMSIRRTVCIVGIIALSGFLSGSRTAELIGVFVLACAISYTLWPSLWKNQIVKKVVTYNAWIMSIITAVATQQFMQGKGWAVKLDNLLSGRLRNIMFHYQRVGVNLFGHDLSPAKKTLDTFYAFLLLGLGIVGLLFVCCMITALLKAAYKKNAIAAVIVLFSLTIYGLSERLWMQVDYNALLLVFRELVFHDVFADHKSLPRLQQGQQCCAGIVSETN